MGSPKPKDFKQYDSRWGGKMYSRSNPKLTIKNNGCGPTAVSDIVATLWDPDMTPALMAALFVRYGYCAEQSGTYRSAFKFVADRYHAARFIRTSDTNVVKLALVQGAYVVALMGKGYWTGGGHYICCWKYDPATDRIYANDPASNTRKSAASSLFAKERKEYFIFFPTDPAIGGIPATIRRGSRGDGVRQMQRLLLKWNPKCLPKFGVDGDFGAETLAAVRAFQKAMRLTIDGITGPQTWLALLILK
jgi:hypothetical protein